MNLTKEHTESVPFQYAESVRAGNIIVGLRVKQAIDRFYNWIDNADSNGFYIDHKKGMMPIKFFENFLIHTKGKSAGKAFELSSFQQFVIYNVYGWIQKKEGKDVRRINNVYEKMAKKNGKTAVMAGLALYHLAFDGEAGPEVYIGATKKEQAALCFKQAKSFINKSTILQALGFINYQAEIRFTPTDGFCKPLEANSETQDGVNCSLAIIDEYHAHKDDSVKENLESSMADRLQPTIWHITTAGFNAFGVCKNYEDSCIEILDGLLEDDHTLIMIHDLDESDKIEDKSGFNWHKPEAWVKANPNLGQTVSMDFLKKEFKKTQNQPSKQPNFKTKHLNMWVDSPEVWITQEAWMKNKVTVDDYQALFIEKAQKFGSFNADDLSQTKDLTASVWVTNADENGDHYIMPYFFCPSFWIDVRSKEDRVPYRYWAESGLITATDGNSVDYNALIKIIQKKYHLYNTEICEFDQYNSLSTIHKLQEMGYECAHFSQSITVMNYPTKQFEKLVLDGKLKHDGHPILAWNLSGCIVVQDASGNIKVHKGKSNSGRKRVDGIVATIMALGGMLTPEDNSKHSKYNDPETKISFGIEED